MCVCFDLEGFGGELFTPKIRTRGYRISSVIPVDLHASSDHFLPKPLEHFDFPSSRATLQLNRPIRTDSSSSFPFSRAPASLCIYVSIPRVRFSARLRRREEGGLEGAEGIIGVSRIRSWGRFVWREARPTYPIRFHHWVGSFPGCQYLQYLTKLIQL